MKVYGNIILWLSAIISANAMAISVIPQPQSMKQTGTVFTIDSNTCIHSDTLLSESADYLRQRLQIATGFKLATTGEKCIEFNYDPQLAKEAYSLTSNASSIRIYAANNAGSFYASQTLLQLLPIEVFAKRRQPVEWQVPGVNINDSPRFGWRGIMLDVSRHFMPKKFLKKLIDTLALHKYNRLHLHLTDNQGWRIQIKKYPKLTEIGAWREGTNVSPFSEELDGVPHGGFYTQDDIRELVSYAEKRHIVIIPEIDIPGHSQAAIASYPELGNLSTPVKVSTDFIDRSMILNVKESTIEFYQNVFLEVMELFPSQYIHVGGDEAQKTQWKESTEVQQRIQTLGLKDEHQLQAWFIQRMNTFIQNHGRTMIGWNDIFEEKLDNNVVIMAWRPDISIEAVLNAGHPTIMTPMHPTYYDYYQASSDNEPQALPSKYNTLSDVYAYDPMPLNINGDSEKLVMGAQGQIWTEIIKTPEHVEYMLYPRALALAEVLWLKADNKDYKDFQKRLSFHTSRLDLLGVNYRRLGNDDLSWKDKLKQSIAHAVDYIVLRYLH